MNTRRPQDFVFTLFGDYLLHRPGSVWVGHLLALLEPLGLKPATARTVLSRMTRRGWLRSRRRGRRSYYDLTSRGRRLLEEGEERIYHPPVAETWDGTWYLIAYSVPEERRQLRDRMRVRLSWLGCGSLGNGLWITPRDVGDRLRELAEGLGLVDHVEVFQARHVGFSDTSHLVRQCWDLEAVNARYAGFIGRNGSSYRSCLAQEAAGELDAEACYVRRFHLIHEYREFPLIDPYLPEPLLPAGWRGAEAAGLFRSYHDLLAAPADAYVASVMDGGVQRSPRVGRTQRTEVGAAVP